MILANGSLSFTFRVLSKTFCFLYNFKNRRKKDDFCVIVLWLLLRKKELKVRDLHTKVLRTRYVTYTLCIKTKTERKIKLM